MKSLTERLKEFGQRLSFMEGRTKGSNKEVEDKVVTIDQYGFLKKEDKEYVAYSETVRGFGNMYPKIYFSSDEKIIITKVK